MINVKINSTNYLVPTDCSLLEALNIYKLKEQVFAIAIDEKLIPRSQYSQVKLKHNNSIDIIIPMQGG